MSTHIYAMPDLTESDGDRGQTGDTEDRGQFEERVVDIYDSVDKHRSCDTVPGLQGQHSKRERRSFRVVAVCLGILCLLLLGGNIGQAVHYNNLTLERNRLQSEVNQLKRETSVKSCPTGWKTFGHSCYYTSTEQKTWEESRRQCLAAGADLLIINSKEEQEFIRGLNQSAWLGLKRTEGNWTLVDGTTLTTGYWYTGYPANSDKEKDWNCAYYYPDRGWYTGLCSDNSHTFICEKSFS